jgi:selenocysteine lyase/cysteine desulfurase
VIDETGVGRIADRIQELAGQLAAGVPDERLHSPEGPESGVVTIDIDDPDATVDRLASEGIVVRALPTPDAVRASVHAVNTRAEVDQLLDALESEWS